LKENPSRDEVHARHILVKTEAEAKAVVKRLRAGEKFEKLARQLSTGPSGKNGGDLGYFTADRMVPPFSAAAFEI
jgi:peptidyl-prolyl cis-trans isomerase C